METKGTGTVVQLDKGKPRGKCRRWQLRVSVGKNPRTGKYSQRTRRFDGSYTEAKRALAEFVEELGGQQMRSGAVPTFEDCGREWVELRRRSQEVAPMTITTYEKHFAALSRHFGKMRVDKLTAGIVQDAMFALMDGDTSTGRCAHAQYIHSLCVSGKVLYRKHAIPMGYASHNPFDGVKTPKVPHREQVVLTEERYQELASKMRPADDGHRIGVLLALLAGLRLGECCAESWGDWQGSRLHVVGSKTKASTATVPISKTLQQALKEWQERQRGMMEELGMEWSEDTPIVTNDRFERMPSASLTVWWCNNRDRLGFPGVRFHDLRHAFVSRCCMLNLNPKVIQRLARHSTFSVTMDIYAAVNDSALDEAVQNL